MAFNTVGIQDNLPVLPVHVLQIIESLTFTGTYSAEDFFREGRTNFGAAAFTSSAHVEMHSLNGADPLVVYSGPFNDTEVFSIDVNGSTTATSLTASNATITGLAVANEAVINSAITTAAISTANIQTATVTSLTAQNGVITTLNGTVGAIATFTASNAQVTSTATIATANVTNLTATNATLTGSLLGTASYAAQALSASYAVSASQAGSALTASFVTGSNVVGTVTSASYALTASYALNSPVGGPGGGQGQIQYYSASVFAGVPTLVYNGTTLTATGSFLGDLDGTASFAPILAGPGITVNGMEVTASVRTVNGISPTNGNIAVSLAGVLTGLSSSNYDINLAASSSGTITSSFSNGALWVVSGETGSATSGSNGQVFIFKSGSVGEWLRVAPLDTAAADARYLQLAGGTMASSINMGGFNATNAGTWQGTAYTASFVTASNVYGPYGASSVVSSSYAVSSSFAVSASWAPTPGLNAAVLINTGSISTTQAITGSLRVTGSLTVVGYASTTGIFVVGSAGVASQYIYPYSGIDFNTTSTNYPGFAHFRPSNTGLSQLSAGGVDYYWRDVNIGPRVTGAKAGSIKIATDTGNTSPTSTITYTLISHGSNVTDNDTNWKTANGRDHALTVSGSMLARDGVSLGTNIANSHIITGSVNMTGSFTLNGTNLSTLVSPVQSVTVNLSQSDILSLNTYHYLVCYPYDYTNY